MQQTVMGIVAKSVNYKDHDRILTLITREHGNITACAHGCRKPQSKLMPCSQVFCYGEYVLVERAGKPYITSCDIHDIFYNLRLRPEALKAASYILNLGGAFADPKADFKKQFSLILNCLKYLCDEKSRHEAVTVFFIAKMMLFEGYFPQLEQCVNCSGEKHLNYFDIENGGVTCADCAKELPNLRRISHESVKILRAIPDVPSAAFWSIAQQIEQAVPELYIILSDYVRYHITI